MGYISVLLLTYLPSALPAQPRLLLFHFSRQLSIDLLLHNPFVSVIALDFVKVFDTLRHSTLLDKIARFPIPMPCLTGLLTIFMVIWALHDIKLWCQEIQHAVDKRQYYPGIWHWSRHIGLRCKWCKPTYRPLLPSLTTQSSNTLMIHILSLSYQQVISKQELLSCKTLGTGLWLTTWN